MGILYGNLALQEMHLNRPEPAVKVFHTALEYHRKVGNEEGLAVTYGQLGKMYLQQKNLQKAEAYLNNATEHFVKLGDNPGQAGALRLLAHVYLEREDEISALRCLERVVQIDQMFGLPQFKEDHHRLDDLRNREPMGLE